MSIPRRRPPPQRELFAERKHAGLTVGYDPATGLVRHRDQETSHEAADAIAPHLGGILDKVLAAYRKHGELTARRCERLPELSDYGFSTVRKRISELADVARYDPPYLISVGKITEGRSHVPANVYAVNPGRR